MTKPRGRLPARVYWVRRTLLLVVVLAVVFGVSRLVGGSPGGPEDPVASPAAAPTGPATTGPTPSATPTGVVPSGSATPAASGATTPDAGAPKPTKTPLAMPTGPCTDSDILVTPAVDRVVAGDDVAIPLELTTVRSPACTWQASPSSLVLKLTSGTDRVWSTQDCPAAISEQSVVVRKDEPTMVTVEWSGRRSDESCSRLTEWAEPGFYHAVAAALGSEPTDVQFELVAPAAPTITPKPKPKQADEKGTDRPRR